MTLCVCNIDATRGTARVEALDANDEAPVFIQRTLFAAVEENAEFGTSVAKLEVSGRVGWVGGGGGRHFAKY